MSAVAVKGIQRINITFPDAENRHLKLTVGACRLIIKPGEGTEWVTGTYDDPGGGVPWRVTQLDGSVRISQEFDASDVFGAYEGPPTFELALGKSKSYALTIETGASDCHLDLGGLPLTRLELKHGADRMELDFSAPNPQRLSLIEVSSGAGSTEIKNLVNADFAELKLEGGLASYLLHFGGSLLRDAHVLVETGLASVELLIPQAMPAKITSNAVLGSLDVGNGFTKKNGMFMTPAAAEGKTPVLSIQANVTFGSARIRII